MVRQREQPLGQRAVERARHRLDRVIAVGVQIGPAGVADQQRVAGEHEPRLVRSPVIGHEIRVMGERVPRSGDRLQLRVAQRHDLSVGQRW